MSRTSLGNISGQSDASCRQLVGVSGGASKLDRFAPLGFYQALLRHAHQQWIQGT
nr:hypothetical protein [Microvirga sp. SRT01]